jgi:hypothetical protein
LQEKHPGMLLTFDKNLIKPVPFSSPWEQVPEPAYIYIYIYILLQGGCNSGEKEIGNKKYSSFHPISTRGDEVKITKPNSSGGEGGPE